MKRRITWRDPIRACVICLGLGSPCIANGASNVDICQEPATESRLSIGYFDYEAMSFERNPGEFNRENYQTELLFDVNNNWLVGGGHRSEILNPEGLQLQTNGYLHTFYLATHWLNQSDKTSFRFSIAPALSASSNVSGDLDEVTADAFQLLAAAVWQRQISGHLGLRYGLCGDHRFGEYLVYPVISVNWQPHPDWTIEFGLPASQISYRVTDDLVSSLRIAPNGNEWYVKDRSLANHSQLVHEAYVVDWELNWRAHKNFMLTAGVGREFHSRYELTLLDETRVRRASDPATRIGVALAWFF